MLKKKLFIFGFGQVAEYFVKNQMIKNKIFLTSTKKTYIKKYSNKKIIVFYFKNKKSDKRIEKILKNSDYILVSIPPNKYGDVVLKKFKPILKKAKFKKLIYLSSTSVYGNHNGSWVNEKSKLKATTSMGKKRILAEKQWRKFNQNFNFDISILRIAGIYSKENNVLKKIMKTKKYIKEKKYFSRIRIEDLVKIIDKMFKTKISNMILNAADDKPSTNLDVANYVAELLGIKKIRAVPISEFKNKMIKNFYKDSKKVSNREMKKKLKFKLKFPNYKIGLKNLFYKSI